MLYSKRFFVVMPVLVGLVVFASSVEAGLVARWAMDDNAGDATVVETSGGADGTFQDADGDPNTSAHTAPGKIGGALQFDGVDDHVATTFPGVLGTTDRTVSFWLKGEVDGQDAIPYLVSWGMLNPAKAGDPPGKGERWSIRLNNNGGGVWAPRTEVQGNGRNGSVNVLDGQWNNIAITWDNNTAVSSMYVNGVLDAAGTGGFTEIVNTAEVEPVWIGSASSFGLNIQGDKRFKGLLDDVRIYDHALSQAEVSALQNVHDEGLPGDYNGNNIVDAADYTVWRDSLGQTGAGLPADGDGLGSVDQADYDIWKANFGAPGSGSAASSAAVPEPATWLLACVMASSLGVWRRR